MGKNEYLVSGAQLKCTSGSEPGWLRIPVGHGYTSGGKNKANCEDCVEKDNIPYFGKCSRNHGTHKCEGFMKLSDKWVSMSPSLMSAEKVNGADAIDMQSVLICKKGGLIMPVTSGQGYQKGVDLKKFAKKFQKTIPWTLGKSFICHILGWDPVNLNTGNYIYEKESLVIPGTVGLSFRLMYNSMSSERDGGMAEGWTHNYGLRIREMEGGFLYLRLDDGRSLPYRRTVGGMYTPVFGDRGIVRKDRDGFLYCTPDNTEYTFDGRGLLLTRKDRNGNTDSFFHNAGGQLMKVSGACGGEFTYTYNREGNLIRVEDHTGRMVRLRYRYGRLWQFVNESGHTYTYGYNEDGRLESIVTPRGITGVYNEYDAANRVVKQVLPDGGVAEMMYDDENMRSYVKNPDGSMVVHEMDERMRNVKNIYADGEETFGYNDNNQRTFYVDKNGNKTKYRYDGRGNLAAVTNALGQVTEYKYDNNNRLLVVSAGGKELRRNTYDEKGRLIKCTDAIGRSREIVYGEGGLPKRVFQPDGSSVFFEYDDRGNMVCVTDSLGSTFRYAYDKLNRVKTFTDAEENTIQYVYDKENHLTSIINPEGNTSTYTYNESGKIVNICDFDGGVFSIEYDAMNNPSRLVDKEGRMTERKYDRMGNLEEEILPSGVIISRFYDADNRPIKVDIRGAGNDPETMAVNSYDYDLVGNLKHISMGNGKEVLSELSYTYDALNRIVQTVNPTGGKTNFAYDVRGHVKSITDPAGNVKTFSYNDAGEMEETTDIYGNTMKYTYNLLGQIASITDGAGRTVRYQYRPGGLKEKVIYPNGRKMSYIYDSLGRIKGKTDGNGYGLFYHYDSLGRIIKVASSTGQEKGYTYDLAGNVISVCNANKMITHYEYSAGGNLTAVIDALGNRTEYTYDSMNNLIHICQRGKYGEEDRETFYERNPLGQTECIRDALGQEEHFQYDALGRVVLKEDKDGYQTAYAYAPDGKLENIAYGDGTRVEMEYTSLRQIALVRDWLGETRIKRDPQGNPVQIMDHEGRCLAYEWGSMGEKRSIVYPDGQIVKYGYDELLRLSELIQEEKGKENFRISYRYNHDGKLSEKRMFGHVSTCWQYDSLGLLKELVHKDDRGILDRYCYDYDAMGNKVRVEKERRGLPAESGNYVYHYDAVNRLKGVEKDGRLLRNYSYDSFGNRTEMVDYGTDKKTAYAYNALNQMVSEEILEMNAMHAGEDIGGEPPVVGVRKTYTYDLRGNMTAEYQGNEMLFGYTYNAMNRLGRAWNRKKQEAEYHYNGMGYRVGKSNNGIKEKYLLDLTKPYHNILEVEGGEMSQSFYWDSNAAAMKEGGKSPRVYLNDELGSPLRVIYGTGKGDVYGYDEFGNDLCRLDEETGSPVHYTKQGEGQPFGYTGYCYDDVSGTDFAQAREYMPRTGRFMAMDIIRGNLIEPRSLNRYGYCYNSPLSYVDFDGNVAIAILIIGAIAAAAIPAAVDFGIQVGVNVYEGKEWNENINGRQIIVSAVAGEVTYGLAITSPIWAPALAAVLPISESVATVGGILAGNTLIGTGTSIAYDTWASEEEKSMERIVLDAALSGAESCIFSGLGMGINNLLGNAFKSLKISISWDKTYASHNFNASKTNSREYHQLMYLLKSSALESVNRVGEIAVEIASKTWSKLRGDFLDLFDEKNNEEKDDGTCESVN